VSGTANAPQSARKLLIELAEARQIRTLALEERLLSSVARIRQSREQLDATTGLLKGCTDQVRSACSRDQSDR